MWILVVIMLIGVNVIPFLLPFVDIWTAQGAWIQLCALVMFSSSFIIQEKYSIPKSIPLALVNIWVGAFTLFICLMVMAKGKMDIAHFAQYFNFLCILVIFKFIVSYLNATDIDRCLHYVKYILIGTLLLCVLQRFSLGQFFEIYKHYDATGKVNVNPAQQFGNVFGMLGNGTHLSGLLAMLSPLLFKTTRENILSLILLIILLFYTGTIIGDPSISGFVIISILLLYRALYREHIIFYFYLFCAASCLILISVNSNIQLFNPQGRLEPWKYYWDLCQKQFVVGYGLGTVRAVSELTPFKTMKHLHFEYFQILLETGIIGLMCVVGLINEFWKKQTEGIGLTCKLIVFGYLLSGLFNYPMHLWMPSVYACFAYAGLIIYERDKKCPLARDCKSKIPFLTLHNN